MAIPGSGAVIQAILNSTYGIDSFNVVKGGTGYATTNPPKIEIFGTQPPTVEGSFYPIVADGEIKSIKVISPGSGYYPIDPISLSNRNLDDNLPSNRSSFQGRVFIKSGIPDNNKDTYSNNYVFDDISDGFVGNSSSFTLKNNNSNIAGISTDNIILLVNNIFQIPSYSNNVENVTNNYTLIENSGVTTIYFTGSNTIPNPSDINTSALPINGVIVSVGSTEGFGYQPLVCAGGTVTVSSSGTISSVSIGNSGSGYRSGVQPIVNVGVKTSNIFGSRIEFIGTAAVSGGKVVGVSITNPSGIGHTNYIPRYNLKLASKISAGSTQISISSLENIKVKNYVSIGTFFSNVEVVGIGSTVFYIGAGSTSQYEVPTETNLVIKEYGPILVFDDPLPYSNIPLVYSSSSSGIGTQAKIDIVVGNGSSVIDFEIKNFGYRYKTGDILTINVGGATGIPTDTSKQFKEFQIIVDKVRNDKFSSWFVGRLQPVDDISYLFNGRRRSFPLKYTEGSSVYSLVKEKGSKIDLNYNILVFLNDVLQVPYDSYTLSSGGSRIIFSTPPNGKNDENAESGDICKILFYMGNSEYDTLSKETLESIKIGDKLQFDYDDISNQSPGLVQDERIVDSIEVSEVKTLPYFGPGISEDQNLSRPIFWKKQVKDIILNSEIVGKDRQIYEPSIQPKAYLINSVGFQSSSIFVDNVRPFFNPKNESISNNFTFQNEIELISQDPKEPGIATAIVSVAGTISSINVTNGGINYSTSPIITLESPVGFGTTLRATAISSITSGIITSILVTYGGTEYSSANPPEVLIEPPTLETEKIKVSNYFGDYGIISGISTGSVAGVASTAIIFDLFIPSDSDLKKSSLTGISGITTICGIQTGYYFIVYNSNVGKGVTSLDNFGSVIGIGTTCLDNVYQAASVSIATSYVPGENQKQVLKVAVSVSSFNELSGIGFSNFYGEYSWGKIDLSGSTKNSYNSYRIKGTSGISTGGLVRRYVPLRYSEYST